jgi:hypothetical protein
LTADISPLNKAISLLDKIWRLIGHRVRKLPLTQLWCSRAIMSARAATPAGYDRAISLATNKRLESDLRFSGT